MGLSMMVPTTLKSSILNPGAPEPVPLMITSISLRYWPGSAYWLRSNDCHSALSALSSPCASRPQY